MVNLEDWVGQEVLVTYANGETGIYKVEKPDCPPPHTTSKRSQSLLGK